jgi:hypothetical protein
MMLDDVDLFRTILLYRFKKIQRVRALRGKTKHYSEGGNFFIDKGIKVRDVGFS